MTRKSGSAIAVIALIATCLGDFAAEAATEPPVVGVRAGTTWLDEVGLYSVGWRGLNGETGAFSTGWTGMFDDRTGVSAMDFGMQGGRRAYLLHPMWRGQSGNADQSYRLALPKAKSVHLRFGVAIGTSGQGSRMG